eukprot:GILK01005936.1.p1 GENE.GILK01005936.1~~GILK01005936.1.p1  ORF type:complete len:403 (+),score=57.74 GILK01005936.1:23-1210(+)
MEVNGDEADALSKHAYFQNSLRLLKKQKKARPRSSPQHVAVESPSSKRTDLDRTWTETEIENYLQSSNEGRSKRLLEGRRAADTSSSTNCRVNQVVDESMETDEDWQQSPKLRSRHIRSAAGSLSDSRLGHPTPYSPRHSHNSKSLEDTVGVALSNAWMDRTSSDTGMNLVSLDTLRGLKLDQLERLESMILVQKQELFREMQDEEVRRLREEAICLEQQLKKERQRNAAIHKQMKTVSQREQQDRQEIRNLQDRLKSLKDELGAVRDSFNNAEVELANLSSALKVEEERNAQLTGRRLDNMSTSELQELEETLMEATKRVSKARHISLVRQVEQLQKANEALKVRHVCRICDDRDIGILLLPCRHENLCIECATKVTRCPICRENIDDRVQTFR